MNNSPPTTPAAASSATPQGNPPTMANRGPAQPTTPTTPTTAATIGTSDFEEMRRELAEMKAEMARQSTLNSNTVKPTSTSMTNPTALEKALAEELTTLRAKTSPQPTTNEKDLLTEVAQLRAQVTNQPVPTNTTSTALERALADEVALLRAKATAASACTSVSDNKVAEHMAREAMYRREPYKATLDRNRSKLSGYAEGLSDNKETLDELFKEFALAARGGGLDPRDAVLLHGLLAPTSFRIKLAKVLLLHNSATTRAMLFNTLVLDAAPPSFEDAYGEVVSQIPWPLFPVRTEFAALNNELLREATAILEAAGAISGGGPRTKKSTIKGVPKVFASPEPTGLAHLVDIVRGAGYAPVADGKADLSEVEAAFNYMSNEIADLRSQVHTLKNKINQVAKTNNNNNNNRGGDRGGYRGGRAQGYRARGGRGTYYGSGDPNEEGGEEEE